MKLLPFNCSLSFGVLEQRHLHWQVVLFAKILPINLIEHGVPFSGWQNVWCEYQYNKWQNWRTQPVVAVEAGLGNSVLVLACLLSEVVRQPRVITLAGEIFHHGLTQLVELNDDRSSLQRTEEVIEFILHSRKLFNVYTFFCYIFI